MAVSPIRRVTTDDLAAVNAAAIAFAARHGFSVDNEVAGKELEFHLEEDKRLARLWQACFCRALGERFSSRLTIAYGYVAMYCE